MKLTDPEIIKEGEKDLIDAIKDDLDLDSINEIVKDKLKVKNLESKGGKIIVHNNDIAFKIEFELSLNGSLMFDRDGNYIPDSSDDSADEGPELKEDKDIEPEGKKQEEGDKTEPEDVEEAKKTEPVVEDGKITQEPAKENEIAAKAGDIEEDDMEVINLDADDLDIDDLNDLGEDDSDEDDSADDSDADDSDDDLSGLDLDIEGFEDGDIDFSEDEDIGNILKESRDFWDKKESS